MNPTEINYKGMIIFAVFGCFLMYFSFSNSIDREKEQANQQIILFQYSMLTALGNLPKDYYGKSMVITGIAENIQNAELEILDGESHGSYIVHNTKVADLILKYCLIFP